MITKAKIKKLLLTEPMDIVDGDSVYFEIDEELGLELLVHYDAFADHDFDGFAVEGSYQMKITCIYIELGDKFIHLDYLKEELQKLCFSDLTEETIKEKYLKD